MPLRFDRPYNRATIRHITRVSARANARMNELNESVLVELDKLEALPQTAWDTDLLRVREWMECSLSCDETARRILMRFLYDHEFSVAMLPVVLASNLDKAGHTLSAASLKQLWIWRYQRRREEMKGSRKRRIVRLVLKRIRRKCAAALVRVVPRLRLEGVARYVRHECAKLHRTATG